VLTVEPLLTRVLADFGARPAALQPAAGGAVRLALDSVDAP